MIQPPQAQDNMVPQDNTVQVDEDSQGSMGASSQKILCPHCLRTATNGIKCQGMCVADSDY